MRARRSSIRFQAGARAIVLGGVAMRHTHFRGHPRRRRGARREDRRDARIPAGRRQCRGHGACRRVAAPPAGRHGPIRSRASTSRRMLESPLAACVLLGGIEPAQDIGLPGAAAGARRLPARRRDHAVRGSRRHGRRAGPAADGQLRRNLGQLRECRRALAGIPRLRAAGRRGAAGLEDPARARQPARARGIRLREFARTCSRNCAGLRTTPPTTGSSRRGAKSRPSAAAPRRSVPIYGVDALVRRAPALQRHARRGRAGG